MSSLRDKAWEDSVPYNFIPQARNVSIERRNGVAKPALMQCTWVVQSMHGIAAACGNKSKTEMKTRIFFFFCEDLTLTFSCQKNLFNRSLPDCQGRDFSRETRVSWWSRKKISLAGEFRYILWHNVGSHRVSAWVILCLFWVLNNLKLLALRRMFLEIYENCWKIKCNLWSFVGDQRWNIYLRHSKSKRTFVFIEFQANLKNL